MNTSLRTSCIKVSRVITKNMEHTWKHVSFLVERNTIISMGWNQPFKSHPLAYKWRYRYNAIHSELHAIINFDGKVSDLARLKIVNVRIDRNGLPALSAPCETCQELILAFGFKEVWFTNRKGEFVCQ